MALLKIATLGHPILRQPSRVLSLEELRSPKIQQLIDDMLATQRDARGAGIAAPQVYEPVRIVIIEVDKNERYPYKPTIPLTILVNPEITFLTKETFANYEGCLSVPDLRGKVNRCCEIRVQALDRHGAPLDFVSRGISAGTFQHEIDHLNGTLFLDRVEDKSSLTTWAHFERFHKDAFVTYVKTIVERYGS